MPAPLSFRLATEDDVPAIVHMLADDALGATRENTSTEALPNYMQAFKKIRGDPSQELTIATINSEPVATFQLTFIQYLTHGGSMRALIESVRVHSAWRGRGIGRQVFAYAINRAKEKGCQMVQLTSDKQRPDAIRFYQGLGFVASHEGMKLTL